MAESSWPGLPDQMPDEPTFGDDELRPRNPNRDSASTCRSRRDGFYDSQRGDVPRSRSRSRTRPISLASQVTTKSKGKHASYQENKELPTPNEDAMQHPIPAQDEDQFPFGGTRERAPTLTGSESHHVRNFSRKEKAQHRRSSGASRRDLRSSKDMSALPPIPQTNRHSRGTIKTNRLSQGTTKTNRFSQGTTKTNRFSQGTTAGGPSRPVTSPKQDEDPERGMDETKSSHLADNPPDPMVSRWLTEVYMVSHLLFFSILGTLARLGTQWITFYPGAPLTTPVIWANMAGSLVMGFLAEDLRLFRTHDRSGRIGDLEPEIVDKAAHLKAKKTIPLYIGLTVGFCGSFTSFSSFARDFFLALSNDLPAPIYHPASLTTPSSTVDRHAGYSFEAVVGVMASTLALSLGGLMVGSHLALAGRKSTPSIPPFLTRKLLDPIMIILGWGCWLGAILLVIWPPDRPAGPASRAREVWRGEVLFALVFAPLGCLLRYYASLRLNGLVAAFPLGTFAVNMFGTAVESMCYDIQHVGVGARVLAQIGGGRVGCQVLQGVMDGFCGCLTTVSTWVLEIRGLRLKHAYVYVLSSLLGGLGLTVAIMGSVRWSHGFSEPACNTGYSSKVHG